jgi:two-component system nitrate/nitrite response regulator NarL
MRVVLCDKHAVFAESLAFLLTARGHDVVAVTGRLAEARAEVAREEPDLCVVGVASDDNLDLTAFRELCDAAGPIPVVLLAGDVDPGVPAEALGCGARGVIDKRQPIVGVISRLSRVHAGELLSPELPLCPTPPQAARPSNDSLRLAAFLTPRERQVLVALVRGDDTAKLATSLGISTTTVRCHVQSLLTKMNAHSRLEVATTAVRDGMVSPVTGQWLAVVS